MIISHEKKFIYFACGRTGSTSVESALQEYNDGQETLLPIREAFEQRTEQTGKSYNLKHARPETVKKMVPAAIWDHYFKFVFVRNPWDWVVSQHFSTPFMKQAWCAKLAPSQWRFRARHVSMVWERKKRMKQMDDEVSYLQYRFAFDQKGKQLVDFIGRFERLQDDFDMICDHLGISRKKLPVKAAFAHKPYHTIYTPSGLSRVAELYEKDIELLGYTFDGPAIQNTGLPVRNP